MKRYLPFLIIAIVLIVAVSAGTLLLRSSDNEAKSASNNAANNATNSAVPAGATPPHTKGPANAPVVLEEFADFQCGACANFHKEMKKIQADYGSRLKVIFRNFPLQQIHKNSLEASRAAEAAGMQGKFWEMHDRLFERQGEWAESNGARQHFLTYARDLGLDVNRFLSDIDSSATSMRSLNDLQRGRALGITGTPSVFINGVRQKSFAADDVRAAIEATLKVANR